MGSVWCICARGTCSGPSRCWSGPWGCARTGTFRSSCPGMAAALGLAYALDGRVAAGLALVEHGVEQAVARGRPRRLALCGRLAQRGVSAGWPPGRGAPTRRAGGRSRPPVPATRHTRPGPCGSWARARRARRPQRSSPPPATTARPSPWPRSWACARSRRTATAASARCMPRLGQREQARTALSTAIELYRAMDDDLLAAPGGGGAGADDMR